MHTSAQVLGSLFVFGLICPDPDSRDLMYERAGQLWRISVDGGEPESLGSDVLLNYNRTGLRIHPNGHRIAFVAEKERRSEVWVIRVLQPGR